MSLTNQTVTVGTMGLFVQVPGLIISNPNLKKVTSRLGSPNSGMWVSINTWRYFGPNGMALFDIDSDPHSRWGTAEIHWWIGDVRQPSVPY